MYRFGAWVALVICQLPCTALRAIQNNLEQACPVEATPSDSAKFDSNSLIFSNPDFNFLDTREFFLSDHEDCTSDLQVNMRHIPSSTSGKQLQQERRTKVKLIKEGLNALTKKQAEYGKKVYAHMKAGEGEETPAADIHMFPEDLGDVKSSWQVLVVPRVKELFGKTRFLCHKEVVSTVVTARCVAKLPFQPLPIRLLNIYGSWDSLLDPSRSIPHGLVFVLELLLVAGILAVVGKAVIPCLKLIYRNLKSSDSEDCEEGQEYMDSLLKEVLPKTFKLAQHAKVHDSVGGQVVPGQDPVEACCDVVILEMQLGEGNVIGSKMERTFRHVKQWISRTAPKAVWARLKNPEGWVVLYDAAANYRTVARTSDAIPFSANPQLLVPISALIRRQLILATSHVSMQWLLLSRLYRFPLSVLVILAVAFFCMHALVLLRAKRTAKWALQYDQVLEQERQRLKPPESKALHQFCLLLAVAFTALLVGLAKSFSAESFSAETVGACFALLGSVVLHTWDLHSSLKSLNKWREPQLTCEFTEHPGEKLPIKACEYASQLTAKRVNHSVVVSTLTWLILSGGLSVLITMALDGFQMQGSLTDYSFTRGHLAYLSEASALHNSLLLHDDTDAVTFMFEPSMHTDRVQVMVEHPLLPDSTWEDANTTGAETNQGGHAMGGHHEINLPAGPLYGRIRIRAWSMFDILPTEYVVHVIRIGEAITLSLKGSVSAIDDFQEKRRWLYQSKNPDWYVPALPSNISVEVQFLPVCFAPFLPASKGLQASHLVHFADSCEQHCQEGEDPQMNFGTNCSREEVVTFETKQQKGTIKDGEGPNVENTSMCLFVAEPKRQLNATKEGSLSGTGSTLVTWLRDTLLSSKAAELRFAGHGSAAELQARTLHLVEDPKEAEAKDGHISNRFSTTVLAQKFLMRNMQLVVATTEDQTDAEEQAVLLRIVPHPPPILLRQNVKAGFFVPDFDTAQQRSNYAACKIGNPSLVEGHVPDTRFEVATTVVILGKSCLGDVKEQKRFSAVRKNQSCTYCHSYQPWNEDYDVAATFSYEQCLYDAIDLGDNNKLQKIAKDIANYGSEETSSCYEVIPRAIHVGRTNTTMLETLLDNKFDPSCAGCPEMPLQAAASGGFVSAMEMLLARNVDVNATDAKNGTALLRASQHCQLGALDWLLDKGAAVDQLVPPPPGTRKCWVTPLVYVLGSEHTGTCAGGHQLDVIQMLLKRGAKLSYQALQPPEWCNYKSTALIEAIQKGNVPAMKVLLESKADATEKGKANRYERLPIHALFLSKMDWPSRSAGAKLLVDFKADINAVLEEGKQTLLMKAATDCDSDQVKLLLELKANTSLKDEYGFTALELAKAYKTKTPACREHPSAHETIVKLLSSTNQLPNNSDSV